jgi:hypothetical protein
VREGDEDLRWLASHVGGKDVPESGQSHDLGGVSRSLTLASSQTLAWCARLQTRSDDRGHPANARPARHVRGLPGVRPCP